MTTTPGEDGERKWTWRSIFDAVIGGALLALAFIGIGASDVSGAGSQAYWSALAIAFGAAAFAVDWVHADDEFEFWPAAFAMAAHWIGVLAALQLVYLFIASGRIANADVGLVNGTLLALGAYLSGVHANWRMIVVGVAVALATLSVAWVEQYLWVLFALALLALVATYLVARARSRARDNEV